MKKTSLKNITVTAICIALCILLPRVFHIIPGAGKLFSPMHIPVLICGLTCAPVYALVCGIVGVLLSSLISSMPALALAFPMAVECAVYGLASSLLMRFLKTGKIYVNIYISLVCSMILGRIAGGTITSLFVANEYSLAIWISAYFAGTLPGIILQLILIPPIVYSLIRSGVVYNTRGIKTK